MKIKNGHVIKKLIWNDKEIIKRIKANRIIYQKETPGPTPGPDPTWKVYNSPGLLDLSDNRVKAKVITTDRSSELMIAMSLPDSSFENKIIRGIDLPITTGTFKQIKVFKCNKIKLYSKDKPEDFKYIQEVGDYTPESGTTKSFLFVKFDEPFKKYYWDHDVHIGFSFYNNNTTSTRLAVDRTQSGSSFPGFWTYNDKGYTTGWDEVDNMWPTAFRVYYTDN